MRNDPLEQLAYHNTLQRLQARVARRPGRWRTRMARSRRAIGQELGDKVSPSTGWEMRCRQDRRHCRLDMDAA